jgi:hypothetical protein
MSSVIFLFCDRSIFDVERVDEVREVGELFRAVFFEDLS